MYLPDSPSLNTSQIMWSMGLALLLLLGSPLLFTLAKFVALFGLTERSHQLPVDDKQQSDATLCRREHTAPVTP